MTAPDFLADVVAHVGDSPLDGPALSAETLGALIGIGQQLRRIADVMPQRTPTLDVLGERMNVYSPEAKAYASVALRKGLDAEPWDIEEVWDVVAAAFDAARVNAEHEATR